MRSKLGGQETSQAVIVGDIIGDGGDREDRLQDIVSRDIGCGIHWT